MSVDSRMLEIDAGGAIRTYNDLKLHIYNAKLETQSSLKWKAEQTLSYHRLVHVPI